MTTNNILIGIVGLAVLGAIGFFVLSGDSMKKDDAMTEKNATETPDSMMDKGDAMQKDDAMMQKEDGAMMDKGDAMQKEDGAMMEKEDAMMSKGSYETYAASKLSKAQNGDVVLFFRASWCPTCKALDANIRANASAIPGGLTILDVDYDNSSELKKKYAVTYQHTLVQVAADGSLIKKWSGSSSLAALAAEVQ